MSPVQPPEPILDPTGCFGLSPTFTHLNHGSVGAVPTVVQEERQRITAELESDPRGFFKQRGERTAAARAECAVFLGMSEPSACFVTNVTTGVALTLHALGLVEGDEVVTTNHGYGAVDLAINAHVRAAGVVHRVASISLTPTTEEVVEAIVAELTPATKLVICDHITSATARLFPVRELAAQLRQRGVALLVDAAHVPGHIDTSVSELGADFWVGNLHKWAFAPRGCALLSVSQRWRERMRPLVTSWADSEGYPAALEFNGTDDFTGWLASPAGPRWLQKLGIDDVRQHNSALATYGQHVLADAVGTPIADPQPQGLAMRLVELPSGYGTTPESALWLENEIRARLRTELAVTSFRGRGIMRVAAQIYNTPADYERLASRLPAFLSDVAG